MLLNIAVDGGQLKKLFGWLDLTKGIFVCDAGFDRDHCAASKPIGKSREKTSGFGGLLGCSADESDGAQSRFVAKEPFHDAGFQIDAIHQVSKQHLKMMSQSRLLKNLLLLPS